MKKKTLKVGGGRPVNCWNRFLTLTYVSNTFVNTFSWQHHMNISALPGPYFSQFLCSGVTRTAEAGSVLNSFSSSFPYERDWISQHYLEPSCTLGACLIQIDNNST